MAKREFVQLAHVYDEAKHGVAGWMVSEKLDGQRAFWDGGITRGMRADVVPFANTEKDARYVNAPIATGLWSRYGKVIHAPGWWLDKLPPFQLDGELYMGRGMFQPLSSIIKTLIPGAGWGDVKFMAFDVPPLNRVFASGVIKNTNFKKTLSGVDHWFSSVAGTRRFPAFSNFEAAYKFMQIELGQQAGPIQCHEQEQLPYNTTDSRAMISERLFTVCEAGGEGLMLRQPSSIWTPERTYNLLKVKRMQDAEATVIGYTWGKETDKGSKLLGLMGSLRCRLDNGIEFDLSGFTDAEREMCVANAGEWAEAYAAAKQIGALHPGEPCKSDIINPKFPIGSRITFKYRELTDAGAPKEARYWRHQS